MSEEEILVKSQYDFHRMPKIPRYFRSIVVTEKLDGTNAAILINDEGVFGCSKNKILSPGKSTDNFGFAAWVESCKDDLKNALGFGLHRGEFWGVGVNRGYGLIERRFSLFNTHKWTLPYLDGLLPSGVHVTPTLYKGPHDQYWIIHCLDNLKTYGSYAAKGYMNPEGIVVFHEQSGHLYKITLENDELAKGQTND